MRAVALVDGEHHAPVVRAALAALPYEWVGAILVGGREKLRGDDDVGVPFVDRFGAAEVVVDLSDEPVLGPRERFRWASRALAAGLPYVGADFRFDPPSFAPFALPSVSVIGTGKRVGKTAIATHVCRTLARDRKVVAVAMGRGGPPEPELIAQPPTVAELLELSRAGRHAASDHLELAALAGVPAIGCRRAGGGLAGAVFDSNVVAGAELAAEQHPDAVVFDGSGAALPPIATSARILVTTPSHRPTEYLNLYRLLIADLVVLMHADADAADRLRAEVDVPVVRVALRLRPEGPLEGRVAVFTAGPAETSHLEAEIVAHSTALGDREELTRALGEADTYLVELKGAAIDVVAEHAAAHGKRFVLAGNDVVALDGDLDGLVAGLVPSEVPA